MWTGLGRAIRDWTYYASTFSQTEKAGTWTQRELLWVNKYATCIQRHLDYPWLSCPDWPPVSHVEPVYKFGASNSMLMGQNFKELVSVVSIQAILHRGAPSAAIDAMIVRVLSLFLFGIRMQLLLTGKLTWLTGWLTIGQPWNEWKCLIFHCQVWRLDPVIVIFSSFGFRPKKRLH